MKIYIHSCGDCQKCGISLGNLANNELKIKITSDPKKCDLLIIIGCLLKNQEQTLVDTWNIATKAKILLFGDCPAGKSELFSHEIDKLKNLAISEKKIEALIPVDYVMEGCPPSFKNFKEFLIKSLKNIK